MEKLPNKIKVLLVDDDVTTVMLLHASIAQWEFEIIEAPDGEAALAQLGKPDAPGIVLVDWMMPKLDGISFCKKVSTLFRPRPYLILCTHNKGTVNLVKAIESGADEFIEKPINLEELRCRLLVATRILTNQYMTIKDMGVKN